MNLQTRRIRLLAGKITLLFLACGIGINHTPTLAQQESEFIPFFDTEDNPVPVDFPRGESLDISPPAPKLNKFDRDVLNICGPIGAKVDSQKFKQLMRSHPQVVENIKAATGNELRPGRRGNNDFIDDLTDIWFRRKGFEHIFCGEIDSPTKIGGLHFYGRYYQLQNQGIGGRLPNNTRNQEVVPGEIYTLGVVIKQGNKLVSDSLKGYGYLSNAEELLVDATRIFKLQKSSEGACIFNVKDTETGKSIPSVFVRRNRAIITFYPDATPQGEKCRGSN